jgi:HAD superfamily hydrolase (TIGR01509 family)
LEVELGLENKGRLKALVFDMDGTLTDSDPIHRLAFAEALAPHGLTLSEERYRSTISGRTNAEIARILFPDWPDEHHRHFSDEKEAIFRRLATALEPTRGLLELLVWADERGLPSALVTNAPRVNADHTLAALGFEGRFRVTVAGEDVARPKPDPEPYSFALERLGIDAREAIAFEDSIPGVRSAKGAGLVTFGLTTMQSPLALREAGADQVIHHFDDESLWAYLAGIDDGAGDR